MEGTTESANKGLVEKELSPNHQKVCLACLRLLEDKALEFRTHVCAMFTACSGKTADMPAHVALEPARWIASHALCLFI